MRIIVAALLIIGLFALNVYLYRANRATPLPEGCENLETPQCHGCGIMDCAIKQKLQEKERENEHANI